MKLYINNIKIEVDYLFIAVYSLVFLFDSERKILSALLAAFCHEMGHIASMLIVSFPPKSITLKLFDIKIIRQNYYLSDVKELFITYSGILVNLILATIFYLLSLNFNAFFIENFCYANLALGLFNSLPVVTLDGASGLIIILKRFMSFKSADKVIDILTFLLLFPLAVLGFIILFKSKYNYSLLFISIYLICVLVLKNNSFKVQAYA